MNAFQYIIIPEGEEPFYTNWCSNEMFPENGGIAINLLNGTFTKDGEN